MNGLGFPLDSSNLSLQSEIEVRGERENMIASFLSIPLSLPPSIFSFSSLLECEAMNTSAFTLGKYSTLDHAFWGADSMPKP